MNFWSNNHFANTISNARKQSLTVVLALVAALVVIVTSVVLAKNNHNSLAPIDTARATTAGPQQTDEPTDMQALLFEVRPFGFNTHEVTVSAGKYLIVLNNRTGRSDLTFRLDRENEARISQSPGNRRDWRERVVLQTGTYVLSEANNPSWTCLIRVTSR